MKVRRRSLLVPVFALIGILIALWLLSRRREVPPLPDEIALPLPPPAAENRPPLGKAPTAPPARAGTTPALAPPSEEELRQTQMEMKISLAALYGAEKSFFAEYNRYSTDLRAIGYQPEAGKELRAKMGFLHAFNPHRPEKNERPDFMSTEEYVSDPQYRLKFTPEAEAAHLDDAARFCHQGCTASDSGFEIAIVTTTNGQSDVWTVNHNKLMTHETAVPPK